MGAASSQKGKWEGQEAENLGGPETGQRQASSRESASPVVVTERCLHTLLRILAFGPPNALEGWDLPAAAVGLYPVANPSRWNPSQSQISKMRECWSFPGNSSSHLSLSVNLLRFLLGLPACSRVGGEPLSHFRSCFFFHI